MANPTKSARRSAAPVSSVLALALALIAAPAMADVKAGVDAWTAGDYTTAVAQWRGPAANGDADAIFNMAQAYRLGRGVDADMVRARELYAEAARKGHVQAADNYGLLLFQQGEQQSAMPLIRDAAERGDPRAQYVLGLAHFNADFAPRDWVRAYALLTLANGSGLPQAGPALAQMDEYVPLAERQQAQVLARKIEAEAAQRRTAQLAAADLGTPQPAGQPAVQPAPRPTPQPQPTQVARAVPTQAAPAARVAPGPAAQPAQTAQPAQAATGKWRVQLGAFGVTANADRLWGQLASNPALRGTTKALVPSGKVTKLQAVGFASRAAAQIACDTLTRQGQACIVAGDR